MALAIFDIDETLISIDSDHAWGEYVVDNNLVDETSYKQQNHQFYEDYKSGNLDIDAYMKFSCSVLARHDCEFLHEHLRIFIVERIKPQLLPKAIDLVGLHRQKGDILVVVTATIEFITRPIAELFGIDHLIAPIPELINGQYTGTTTGTNCFGAGKVIRLDQWLRNSDQSLVGSFFYSDSVNDLPLLERVDNPVVVDPDPKLAEIARTNQWPIISLRS